MIYELRVYQPIPGKMPNLLARFGDHTVPIWQKHGIRALGFWTTLIGESSNELTYILQWESLADRETRWTAFQNDPAWHRVRDDSERDGPIVASISNQILMRTAFSARTRPVAVRIASLCSPRSTRPSFSSRFNISPAEARDTPSISAMR